MLTWAPILTRGHSRLTLAYKNKMHRVKPDSQQPPVLRKNRVCRKDRKINVTFIWSIIKNISAMTGEECPKYIDGKCSKPIHCLGDALDKHMISIINRKSSRTETC